MAKMIQGMPTERKESDLMNSLWQVERLVELKLQEINREIEHDRLVKEARVPGPSLLARLADGLRSLLNPSRKDLRAHASVERRSYPSLRD
jgi:hypothetical protein